MYVSKGAMGPVPYVILRHLGTGPIGHMGLQNMTCKGRIYYRDLKISVQVLCQQIRGGWGSLGFKACADTSDAVVTFNVWL